MGESLKVVSAGEYRGRRRSYPPYPSYPTDARKKKGVCMDTTEFNRVNRRIEMGIRKGMRLRVPPLREDQLKAALHIRREYVLKGSELTAAYAAVVEGIRCAVMEQLRDEKNTKLAYSMGVAAGRAFPRDWRRDE